MKRLKFIPMFCICTFIACELSESFTFNVPVRTGGDKSVHFSKIILSVIDEQGNPIENALIGTIPTLNRRENIKTPTDQQERAATEERYATDAQGQYIFKDKTYNVIQGPLFFNAYKLKEENGERYVFRGSSFMDIEEQMDSVQIITVVAKSVLAVNQTLKVAMFDSEPFPRAVDFFTLESIYFRDVLNNDYYGFGDTRSWTDWNNTTAWDAILSESNLAQFDVFVVGFDAGKYAEHDQLVRRAAEVSAFVKNHPDKLLFICQANPTGYSWKWVADFDVPQQGAGGGFLKGTYQVANFETAFPTAKGIAHPLLKDTKLISQTDDDANGVFDVWENWHHIEPNKPEVKLKVVWHAGNVATFEAKGWDILVRGPAVEEDQVPRGEGVILAVKKFNNGSRVIFCDATYYQGSYGPRKSISAIKLKDQLIKYITTWPAMREN